MTTYHLTIFIDDRGLSQERIYLCQPTVLPISCHDFDIHGTGYSSGYIQGQPTGSGLTDNAMLDLALLCVQT